VRKFIGHVTSVYFGGQNPKFSILCSVLDAELKLLMVIRIDKTNTKRAKKIKMASQITYFTDQIFISNIWSVKCTYIAQIIMKLGQCYSFINTFNTTKFKVYTYLITTLTKYFGKTRTGL